MTDVRVRTTAAGYGLHRLVYAFGLLVALLTAGCGNDVSSVGTAVITLSAEPGRFTSYIVTIDQITLTREDGTLILLPTVNERVDLANLHAYTNVLAAPPVGVGTYVSATVLLDFINPLPAFVSVGHGGRAVAAAVLDPANLAPVTTQTVKVQLDPRHPLVINDQQSSVLAIDIDLEASNIIGPPGSDGIAKVTVKPFWNVTAQPSYDKPTYVRGLYVVADTENHNFVMNVRPLHDVLNRPLGAMRVNVDDNTYYNVNGATYIGAPGLATLSALTHQLANLQIAAYAMPRGSPFADLSAIRPVFTATQVYVGSAFESVQQDQITGIVAGVLRNTLTLQGAAFVSRVGGYGFTQSIPVTVGPNTAVSIDGRADATPTLSSVSVGQVVTVMGLGDQLNVAAYNPRAFDATGSVIPGSSIRIQNTPLLARFKSANGANGMLVNVALVDQYEPMLLDYTGTGSPQADPTNYEVSTATNIGATAPGTYLEINGITTAFGRGPPFFSATRVSSDVQQQLVIEWGGSGAANPFPVVNANGLAVNLADPALTGSIKGVAAVRNAPSLVAKDHVLDLLASAAPNRTPALIQINLDTRDPHHPPLFGVGSASVGSMWTPIRLASWNM